MKKLYLFIAFIFFISNSKAQNWIEYKGKSKLKGHVKQIIEYDYYKLQSIDSLGKPVRTIKNFDDAGSQVDEIHFGENGNLESEIFFDNSKAYTILQSCYDYNGDVMWKAISKYDNKGNEIERRNYIDGTMAVVPETSNFKIIYQYDGEGNMVQLKANLAGGTLNAIENFIYNKTHQITEQDVAEYSTDGVTKNKTFLQYGLEGNKITSKKYKSNGKLDTELVTLYSNIDDQGNWLTETDETKLYGLVGVTVIKDVIKREIIYYK